MIRREIKPEDDARLQMVLQILAHAWPSDYDGFSNTVDVFNLEGAA